MLPTWPHPLLFCVSSSQAVSSSTPPYDAHDEFECSRPPPRLTSGCRGLRHPDLASLYRAHHGGVVTKEFMKSVKLRDSGFPTAAKSLDAHRRGAVPLVGRTAALPDWADVLEGLMKLPLWYGAGRCIRSSYCTETMGSNSHDDNRCGPCEYVFRSTSIWKMAAASIHNGGVVSASVRHTHLNRDQLLARLQLYSVQRNKLAGMTRLLRLTLRAARSAAAELREKLKRSVNRCNSSKLVRNLLEAEEAGLLKDDSALKDILTGISRAVRFGRASAGKRSENEKVFYCMLMQYGGPLVHKFVSKNLMGPDERTTRRHRAKQKRFTYGFAEEHVQFANEVLESYGLQGAPYIICEDATALSKHLDVHIEGGNVMLYGLNLGPHMLTSCRDIGPLMLKHGLATSLYVWVLVPLVDGAPHIPLFMEVNDNRWTADLVWKKWRTIWRLTREVQGKLVGHASDGDARLRNAFMRLMAHRNQASSGGYVECTHPLVQFRLPKFLPRGVAGGEQLGLMGNLDYIHVLWRWRVLYLSTTRVFKYGATMLATPGHVRLLVKQAVTGPGLGARDLDQRDKQNWPGTLRLFGFTKDGVPTDAFHGMLHKDRHSRADWLYLHAAHRFARIFVCKNRSVLQHVKDAAYVLTHVGLWHQLCIESRDCTLKDNFLTRETYTDTVISMSVQVLAGVGARRGRKRK